MAPAGPRDQSPRAPPQDRPRHADRRDARDSRPRRDHTPNRDAHRPRRADDHPRRRSRSRSPQRNPRDTRQRSPPRRQPPPSRSQPPPRNQTSRPKVVEEEAAPMQVDGEDEEAFMARVMGFSGFKTTKNTKVPGNDKLYAVRKDKVTEYRQYMNRVGGFNRPLSPSRM